MKFIRWETPPPHFGIDEVPAEMQIQTTQLQNNASLKDAFFDIYLLQFSSQLYTLKLPRHLKSNNHTI
jgi:hypothetical protein